MPDDPTIPDPNVPLDESVEEAPPAAEYPVAYTERPFKGAGMAERTAGWGKTDRFTAPLVGIVSHQVRMIDVRLGDDYLYPTTIAIKFDCSVAVGNIIIRYGSGGTMHATAALPPGTYYVGASQVQVDYTVGVSAVARVTAWIPTMPNNVP
jgi:hypothetical protein